MNHHIHVKSFDSWRDAYDDALFWADLTGHRYRVHRLAIGNLFIGKRRTWWQITQLTTRHAPEAVKETR